MANEYTTVNALKSALTLTGTTFADSEITLAIAAASRAIERECGRRFWMDSTNQTRYYERTSAATVVIDDLATVSSIKTDPTGEGSYTETWTENTDYVFGPQNAAADGLPYMSIYSLYSGDYIAPPGYLPSGRYFLPRGPRRIQVIGKFGWPAVPDEVTEATTFFAARLLKRAREAPFGVISMGLDGGAVRIPRIDPDIAVLLQHLHRGRVGSNGMGLV